MDEQLLEAIANKNLPLVEKLLAAQQEADSSLQAAGGISGTYRHQ